MASNADDHPSDSASSPTVESAYRFESTTGPAWPGIDVIRHLFVFGDSYSSVGYEGRMIEGSAHPSLENPLGIEFPGLTWTDDSDSMGLMGMSRNPNWVGHLINSRKAAGHPLIVYDYAIGGNTVSDVRRQITQTFATHVASQPEWAPWTENDSLFVVWVGINDCAGMGTLEPIIKRLFGSISLLYEMGARNFLLIDVPPIDKSPASKSFPDSILKFRPELAETYKEWNSILHKQAKTFHEDPNHEDCTILMYSSYDLFMKVNEWPQAFDFLPGDVKKKGGSMWMDQLHPTSKMHKVIADDIEEFLKAVRLINR